MRIDNLVDDMLREAANQLYSDVIPTWKAVEQKVNMGDCILPAVRTNTDISITEDNCLQLMRLYEVGLLCDMEYWLKLHTNANCIEILKMFNFTICI